MLARIAGNRDNDDTNEGLPQVRLLAHIRDGACQEPGKVEGAGQVRPRERGEWKVRAGDGGERMGNRDYLTRV